MCYSGKCIRELHNGDCGFPTNKKIREIYPHPVCEIYDNEEDYLRTQVIIEDIKNMLKEDETQRHI